MTVAQAAQSGDMSAAISEDEDSLFEPGIYEFDEVFQSKIAALFGRDTTFALKTKDLIRPEYFTVDTTAEYVRIVQEHVARFGSVPDLTTLISILKSKIANKNIRPDLVKPLSSTISSLMGMDISNGDYVAEQVETFAQHQAIEQALVESTMLLQKGQFDKIKEKMRLASSVGLVDVAEDYDYYNEIESRTKKREDVASGVVGSKGITTGYPEIDVHLYHGGWGRKELSCMMGPAKSGKSLSLGDFAKNASLKGYNALYISLEVAKEIISERIDAALSDTLMRDLVKNREDVADAIRAAHNGAGVFKVVDYPTGTLKPSGIKRLLDRYRAQGIVFDLVVVDYADIMASEFRSDDLRENLRTIYIDLRAIAHEYNLALLTATQTNRDGAKAATAKATDVGDDWNKARTVDILIGLNATDAEKANGEARLYWALSRNTADGFTIRIKQDRSKMKFLTQVVGVET